MASSPKVAGTTAAQSSTPLKHNTNTGASNTLRVQTAKSNAAEAFSTGTTTTTTSSSSTDASKASNNSPSRYTTRRSLNVATPSRTSTTSTTTTSSSSGNRSTPTTSPTSSKQQTTPSPIKIPTTPTTPTRRPRGRPSKGTSTPTATTPIPASPQRRKTITPPTSASRSKPSGKRARIQAAISATTTTSSSLVPRESTMQPLIRAALERRMVINAVMHISFYRWCRLYFQNNLSSPDQILPHELEDTSMVDGDAQLKASQELSKWFAAAANGEKALSPLQIMKEAIADANQRRLGQPSESSSLLSSSNETPSSHVNSSTPVSSTETTLPSSTPSTVDNNSHITTTTQPSTSELVLMGSNEQRNPDALLESHLQHWRTLKECWNERYAVRTNHYKSKLKAIYGDVFT